MSLSAISKYLTTHVIQFYYSLTLEGVSQYTVFSCVPVCLVKECRKSFFLAEKLRHTPEVKHNVHISWVKNKGMFLKDIISFSLKNS